MELAPTDASVIFVTVIMECIVMYLYLLLLYLFYLAFRTHVLSCVLDMIVIPNLI
jgi:hypothetical protein